MEVVGRFDRVFCQVFVYFDEFMLFLDASLFAIEEYINAIAAMVYPLRCTTSSAEIVEPPQNNPTKRLQGR